MKTTRLLAITLFLGLISSDAYGAALSYTPDHAAMTVAAGSSGTIPLTVSILNITNRLATYELQFVDTIADGNLPVSWIDASISVVLVNLRGFSASTVLTIRVPQGTSSGVYSGHLRSKATSATDTANQGAGLFIEVTVPPSCIEVPAFEIVFPSPVYLWPPNHSMEVVTVSGSVLLPDGCTLSRTGYNLVDEYGIYTSTGALTVGTNNNFTASVSVEAWRNGGDGDGRYYHITLFAEDEAGMGTSDLLEVLVPHDQRDKDR